MISIIDSIFHTINTAVLGVTLWYLFRKYAYNHISQHMTMFHAMFTNLIKRNEQLRKQEQGLVRAYYHQNYRYEELSHKVEQWSRKVEQREHVRAHEGERISQALHRRSYLQGKHLQESHDRVLIIGKIIAEFPQELTAQLGTHSEQLYTHRLIQKIVRGDHVTS